MLALPRHDYCTIGYRRDEWNYSGDIAQRAVEPELCDESQMRNRIGRNDLLHNQQANGNRGVEARTALALVHGCGQVNGDAFIGPRKIARQQRSTNPIARFATRLVWLADNGETRQAHANMNFDIDRAALHPEQCC
jgi:hypothetical protein